MAALSRASCEGCQTGDTEHRAIQGEADSLRDGGGNAHAGERAGAVAESHELNGAAGKRELIQHRVHHLEHQGRVLARRDLLTLRHAGIVQKSNRTAVGCGFESENGCHEVT